MCVDVRTVYVFEHVYVCLRLLLSVFAHVCFGGVCVFVCPLDRVLVYVSSSVFMCLRLCLCVFVSAFGLHV